MMRGIFAGDAKDISVYAIAGQLFEKEQKDGGVLKSVLKTKMGWSRTPKVTTTTPFPENQDCELNKKAQAEKWAIWSLEGGLESLIDALKQRLIDEGVEIVTGVEDTCDMIFEDHKCRTKNVKFVGKQFEYDFQHSFLALPAYSAAKLFKKSEYAHLQQLLSSIPYVDVAVINVEYDEKLELSTGEAFGLLVPSSQKHVPILGIIFDTCTFPQQLSNGAEKTVFTVMMGGKWFKDLFGNDPNPKDLEDVALEQIKAMLKITQPPTRVLTKIHRNCIAQYIVGHKQKVEKMRDFVKSKNIPISLIGSAYDGVAINDAILSARQHVNNL